VAESLVQQRAIAITGDGCGLGRVLPRPVGGGGTHSKITDSGIAVSNTVGLAEFAVAVIEFTEGLKR
jgi:hypothetical protein